MAIQSCGVPWGLVSAQPSYAFRFTFLSSMTVRGNRCSSDPNHARMRRVKTVGYQRDFLDAYRPTNLPEATAAPFSIGY